MTSSTMVSAKRKRRHTGSISIHAILLLLACGSPFQFLRYGSGKLPILVEALISPSRPSNSHNHWLQSRYHALSTSPLMATNVADRTSTQTKGQTSTKSNNQQKRRSSRPKQKKKKSSRKGNYKRSNNRIKQRSNKTSSASATATPAKPWNADYSTSLRTQRKIQSAAAASRLKGSSNSNNTDDPVRVAHSVLKTLLNAPPTECNAANLVCALTLSSKTLNNQRGGGQYDVLDQASPSHASFQKSLMKTLTILQTLVSKNQLTPRQLCNAAWSIAKHVEYDTSLFSSRREKNNFVLVNKSSTWDLREQIIDNGEKNGKEEEGSSTDELIDEVFNLIALRVTEHLEEKIRDTNNGYGGGAGGSNKRSVQPGELSMLLWAYAVAKPRDCPPGWEQPRRLEQRSKNNNNQKEKSSSSMDGMDDDDDFDFVTFVELEDGDAAAASSSRSRDNPVNNDAFASEMYAKEEEEEEEGPNYQSITSQLFDAAAIAFCQGEGAAVKESAKGEERTTLLKNCTWSELSNIAWSYATRGAYGTKASEAMMTFFAKEATRRIRYCSRLSSSSLPSNNNDEVCNILPRDVIQIAWALGTMESDNVSIGDALVHLVGAIDEYWIDNNGQRGGRDNDRPLAKWTCADLVQMSTALAHGRLDNQSVLSAVYEESLKRLLLGSYAGGGAAQQRHQPKKRDFSTREISILMWAQARLYLTSKFGDVYGAFPSAASRLLLQRMESSKKNGNQEFERGNNDLFPATTMHQKGLGPQEQANLAWSLTVLETYDENVVSLLQNIFHAASSNDEGVIQLEHAHQLWQSYFLLSKDCPDAVKFVPREFSQYLEEKWNIEKSRSKQSSSRHKSISQTLDLMRVAHRNEYDEDVDVAIVLEEDSAWTHMAQMDFDHDGGSNHWKVAVEFDGPHHFTVMVSTEEDLALMESGVKIKPRVLGHTVLKYRLLKKKGWTVVRIPYYEFDKIPYWASMERQRYLQRALKTHDKIEFSGVDVSEYKAMPTTRHSRFD
ncbi:hypothetical protein ACHAXR_009695 [Thalassiosira sp. AJA248-18]